MDYEKKNIATGIAVLALILPISIFQVSKESIDYSQTIIIGVFYVYESVKLHGSSLSGFGFLQFPEETSTYPPTYYEPKSLFHEEAWEAKWAFAEGGEMWLLWQITFITAIVGTLMIAFKVTEKFPPKAKNHMKIGGIFLLIAAITSLAFTIIGYQVLGDLYQVSAIPISTFFFLLAAIIAFRIEVPDLWTKEDKKEL